MNTALTPAEVAAKIRTGEWTMDDFADFIAERDRAADEARREAALLITPHVLRAPAKRPGRMSGPRYFNLMRAIEANPEQYADYRPTTYCGAARTSEDLDRRDALSWLHRDPDAVAARGVCPDCLTAAARSAS